MHDSLDDFILIRKKTDQIALEYYGFYLNEIKVQNIMKRNEAIDYN